MRVRYKVPSLQQIRAFGEVCRTGGFAPVARALGLSTSAVWEQVRGLERAFESALVERRRGAVRPTPEGRALLDLLMPLVAGFESCRETFRQLRGRAPESLTVVSGMRMLLEEVAGAAASFRRRHPGVRLRLLYAEDREIESIVERREADLALTLDPGPGHVPRPAVVHEPAYDLDFVLLTPPRHPLQAKRPLRLAHVVRYPLVVGARATSTRRRIEEVFHRHGLTARMKVAVETNSAAVTFAGVRAGAGVGITAANLRGSLGRGLGVRSLRPWFGVARFVFIWPRGSRVPPLQRELADLIRSSLEA
jgi:DNA-binding transcriptional LysR family regulator